MIPPGFPISGGRSFVTSQIGFLHSTIFTLKSARDGSKRTKRIVVPRRLNPRRRARRTNQRGQSSEDIIKKKVSFSQTIALPGQTIDWFHRSLCLCRDIESVWWFPVHAPARAFLKGIICACFDACFGSPFVSGLLNEYVCAALIRVVFTCIRITAVQTYYVLRQRYRYINVFKHFSR